MESKLDPIFQAQIDAKKVAGVAAVALNKNGEYLFNKGYGHATIDDPSSPKVTPQTPAMIWSCTKLVTAVAGLQLVEQGKLHFDDPAEKHVPDIKKIQKLLGWNDDGSPKLGPSESTITILNLFTHTSGLAYDFFDPDSMKWRISQGQTPVSYVTKSSLEEYTNPLIFEAGERWEYGPNLDWLGFVIERVSGLSLEEYIQKNIAKPLGLKTLGKGETAELDKEFLTVHTKDNSGKLTATPLRMVQNAEVEFPGGHYLYSSTDDYAQFLLTLLNDGTHPKSKAQILEPETVKKYIFTDMLPSMKVPSKGVGGVPSTAPPATLTGEFAPGVSKGWSCGALINNEALPNGRSKGSAAWAGLGNCYFWIDPTAGKLGFVVAASLPFFDRDVLHLADALERAVYGKPMAKEVGEKGSNFEGGHFDAN